LMVKEMEKISPKTSKKQIANASEDINEFGYCRRSGTGQ
jgi:hypothetical protein